MDKLLFKSSLVNNFENSSIFSGLSKKISTLLNCLSSNKSRDLPIFKGTNIKFESYSYIPNSNIPTIFKVLYLGIFPKIVESDFGIAILISSFNVTPNFLDKLFPIIASLELLLKILPIFILVKKLLLSDNSESFKLFKYTPRELLLEITNP